MWIRTTVEWRDGRKTTRLLNFDDGPTIDRFIDFALDVLVKGARIQLFQDDPERHRTRVS
jgi:hypothetical protein